MGIEWGGERSGAAHRITSKRSYDQTAHHQPTNSTDFHASMGDPAAQAVAAGPVSRTPTTSDG
jgi:hypothetical protein